MARPYRLQAEGCLYHITSRGDDRKKIFISDYDFEKFIEYIKTAQVRYKFYLYAYCLMSNHYHLLLETTQANLSRIMQYINTAYTAYYNKKRNKRGHLFQGRFKSILVEKDVYFQELTRYIHLNPVRAKIVDLPQKYKWSSYNDYLKSRSGIIDISRIKRLLDMDIKQYIFFVMSAINGNSAPFKNIYAGFILGRENFVKEQLKELAIQVESKEFAYKKILLSDVNPDDIINYVAQSFRCSPNDIKTSKRRPQTAKRMAIYLIRQRTPLTNGQIGKIFNMKSSAVSKAGIDFKRILDNNKSFRKVTNDILSKMEV